MMDYEDLGHKLKVERTKLNYKQDYLAEKVGVGQRYISKIEHGLARPEFEKVYKIATLLGVSLDYLAGANIIEKNPDYITNTINIRLQLLSDEEKLILLQAVEYYIQNIKEKRSIKRSDINDRCSGCL